MAQVSVIIPTYNRAGFLRGAVQSVLDQSYKDVEIIVVDDGSTDETAAVVESFDQVAIRYLRHDRRCGSGAARNTGVLHAGGEYVAFLDDDDEWYPEKLMRQMEAMATSPAEVGAVYTGSFCVDPATRQIVAQRVPTARGDVHKALLGGNCVGGASSMLMRRGCFDRVGLFDERLASLEDHDLWLRTARLYQFESIRAPLVKCSVHPDRISANPESLGRGLEAMLKKYGGSRLFRRRCSAVYLALGVHCCEANQFSVGRRALLRACRLNPLALAPYAYLGFALLGGDGFRRARRAQTSLRPRLGRREIQGFAESV